MRIESTRLEDLMMAMVGLESIAYIKPVNNGIETGYAVFAADGTQLAMYESQESAYYNTIRHNLAPMSIH